MTQTTSPDPVFVLEAFGVPSARFDAIGRLLGVSSAAADLLGVTLPEALRQGAKLVAELATTPGGARGQAVVRTRPVADGRLMLRAQRLPPTGADGFAVVLFLPAHRSKVREDPRQWGLSAREAEVARHIARGASTKEVAAQLGISLHTARRHTERVFAKLGVQSRSQVVLLFASAESAAD